MTRITIKVDNPEQAKLLVELLQSVDFVKEVETSEVNDSLSETEILMLEDRLKEYQNNPEEVTVWNEVLSKITSPQNFSPC